MILALLACVRTEVPAPGDRPRPPAPVTPSDPTPPDPTPPEPGARVTWSGEVGALVERECVGCHREGGGAPFAIDGPEVAAGAIGAALDGTMPPARFDEACRTTWGQHWLDADELAVFAAWRDAGYPEGRPGAWIPLPPLTAPPTPAGDPDVVFEMTEPYAPADDTDEVAWFEPPARFAQTTFVTAARVTPGEPRIVHHVTVFAVDDAGQPVFGDAYADSPSNALAAWAPGQPPWVLPADTAFVVPAGAHVRFEIHYSTVGRPAGEGLTDTTRLELWTLPGPPSAYAYLVPLVLSGFEIPAGDPAYTWTEEGPWPLPDATILAATPHLHLRGSAARAEILRPDGDRCLVDTPNYDFHHQVLHAYVEPVPIRAGDGLRISCTWDNGADHQPLDADGVPLPPVTLYPGDGTLDEMCQIGLLVSRPYGAP